MSDKKQKAAEKKKNAKERLKENLKMETFTEKLRLRKEQKAVEKRRHDEREAAKKVALEVKRQEAKERRHGEPIPESLLVTITKLLGDAVIPAKHRIKIVRYMHLSEIDINPYLLFGNLAWSVLALSLVVGAIMANMGGYGTAPLSTRIILFGLLAPVFFVIFIVLGKFVMSWVIEARIYKRVREMEAVFPEFLAEVSMNLKAGSDLEEAIGRAAEEDYGFLSQEMHRVAKRSDLGFELASSIRQFTEDLDSNVMQESFELILMSWRSGAETPRLVDRIVENMKVMRTLQQKIVASVANYRIFLATVTVAIAPAMMALAFHVIDLIRDITTQVMEVTRGTGLPFTINAVRFSDGDFIWFSVITLIIISSSSALIVTHINSGSTKGAGKYLFTYVFFSLISYLFFITVFQGFFQLFA